MMTDHELKSGSQDAEVEAAEAALVGARGLDLRQAAEHVVAMLRPSMWLGLQRKIDGLEAQVERLLKLLHPSSQ